MSYLNNTAIIVDAILTKKGRELLAQNGSLNITSFALADDEIDYGLYNPNAPTSTLMDVALLNTPVFEPSVDETQNLKYKLVTLPAGTTFIPTISIAQDSIQVSSDYSGRIVISPSTNPANYNTTLGYTAILANNSVGTLTVTKQAPNTTSTAAGTVPLFAGDISNETSQTVVGLEFAFVASSALSTTTTTTLTIIGNESGGGVSIPVTVTVV